MKSLLKSLVLVLLYIILALSARAKVSETVVTDVPGQEGSELREELHQKELKGSPN